MRQISGLMVAEVCSIYFKRQDGSLELFATEGLNPDAVHRTLLKRGEGLVGRCAEIGIPINEPDAQKHPAFSYRPETGEEIYHSLLAVPILRGGVTLGVIVVQNKTLRVYSEEDVDVLQAATMVIAEQVVSGAVAGVGTAVELSKSLAAVDQGRADLGRHRARPHRAARAARRVTNLLSDDPQAELARLEAAHEAPARDARRHAAPGGAVDGRRASRGARGLPHVRQRQGLGAAHARCRRAKGLTAEAAVERVQNATRARMLRQNDPFWRERLRDLDDLSDRLLRILAGRTSAAQDLAALPDDAILVARTMGPAELLDYDRAKLRGLVIEDGSGQSHVAIVARALGIAAVGGAHRIIERVSTGDPAIVDAETGEVHLRPSPEVIQAYSDKVRFRARRQQRYQSLRDSPAVTTDGVRDRAQHQRRAAGRRAASARGRRRRHRPVPHRAAVHDRARAAAARRRRSRMYRQVLEAAGDKRVVFRALDIGGDKALPYIRHPAGGEPGARLARDPAAARPLGAAAPADARAADRRRKAASSAS